MYPKLLEQLIEELKKFPSVGNKTAQRYALKLLSMSDESVMDLATVMIEAKKKIKHCHQCGNYTEEDLCEICQSSTRNKKVICVVVNPTDILAIEKTKQYQGLYHVLGGLISPANHVMPDDLSIASLTKRVEEGVDEIILALSATVEGEMTALYLAKLYQDKTQITHLAQGLPMGSMLEYIDELTLIRSLMNRKKMELE